MTKIEERQELEKGFPLDGELPERGPLPPSCSVI